MVSLPTVDFLSDLSGELQSYVFEELNVRQLNGCADPMQYATIKAEPNYGVLGKRLGKAMGPVSKAIKDMSQDDILKFQFRREGGYRSFHVSEYLANERVIGQCIDVCRPR